MRLAPFLLAVALLGGAWVEVAPSQSSPAEPTLRLVKRTPVVIEGHGFSGAAVVTLVVRAPGLDERRTLRPSLGRFRTVIPGLSLTGARRCAVGVVIWARTEAGAVALWQPKGLPNCSAPLRPRSG